jgi:hypothetical protein
MTRKKMTKTQKLVKSAFHEIKQDQPKVVTHTIAAKGTEVGRKQKIAIALSKARAKGARIPRRVQ